MLTEAVTRLRRALRASIRTELPRSRKSSCPWPRSNSFQVLAEHPHARVSDLATRQRLATSTVSGLISQMITAGLVVRNTDPDDRRVCVVTLTDAGHAQADRLADAHERRLGSALTALDDTDRATVRAALPALLRLAEQLDDTEV